MTVPPDYEANLDDFVTDKQRLATWLAKRQSLLSVYWKLSGLSLLDESESTEEELAWFSQSLVDYLAEGHFAIYANLIEDIKRYTPDSQPQVNFLYSSILSSTASLVDISDETAKMSLAEFETLHDKVLGHFGHDWAHHLEMEDNLIKIWQEAYDFMLDSYELDEKRGS
jgi:regulator of sigma D